MNIEKILAISGKPGLFKLHSQSKGGFIVEDLESGKKTSISAQYQVSLLDNISIYTYEEDMPLSEIFNNMAKIYDGKPTISHKSSDQELRDEMRTILENYDEERVYTSDIKKLIQWYNLMANNGMAVYEANDENSSEENQNGEE